MTDTVLEELKGLALNQFNASQEALASLESSKTVGEFQERYEDYLETLALLDYRTWTTFNDVEVSNG